jgi:hypothetical protein
LAFTRISDAVAAAVDSAVLDADAILLRHESGVRF